MAKKRKNLDMDLITSLREMGLTWTQIQQHPEVAASKRTISRWRQRENFVEPRQRVSDDQLDAHQDLFQVPRQQLRDSIHRVDPEGVLERSHKAIKRVVYRSHGPHHDWHMD
eukprot:gene37118-48485_t